MCVYGEGVLCVHGMAMRCILYPDVGALGPIMSQVQQQEELVIGYGHLKLTVAVIAVKTGFVRKGRTIITSPLNSPLSPVAAGGRQVRVVLWNNLSSVSLVGSNCSLPLSVHNLTL